MIQLKSAREIEIMARGGRILAATHEMLAGEIRAGMTTADIDKLAESFIRSHEGARPSFKGLYGFPGSVCASVNEEIVHGIPSPKRILQEGDVIAVDVGVHLEGYHTDGARTYPVGEIDAESRTLLEVTARALAAGVDAARLGNHVGDIGAAIFAVVKEAGFTVADNLVGHGVGAAMHEDPQVPNEGTPKRGVRLAAGMTLAIEPMVNIGTSRTRELRDKWTVVTADGKRSAHFEHTVAVTADGPRVLTSLG